MDLSEFVDDVIEQLEDGADRDALSAADLPAGLDPTLARAAIEACAKGFEFTEQENAPEPDELVSTLIANGVSADLAKLVCDTLYVDEGDDDEEGDAVTWGMELAQVEGVHVLRLSGDVRELDPAGREAIRAKILTPLFAEDCRLVIDLRGASFLQADVVGLLISDVAAMRDAGGDLSVVVGENLAELAERYRLPELVRVESEPEAMARLQAMPQAPLAVERLQFEVSDSAGVGVLSARGALDPRTLAAFEQRVTAQLSETPTLVLDLAEVSWISSAGFAVLAKLAMGGSRVELANLRGPAALVAEILGLSAVLSLHPSREAALAACST